MSSQFIATLHSKHIFWDSWDNIFSPRRFERAIACQQLVGYKESKRAVLFPHDHRNFPHNFRRTLWPSSTRLASSPGAQRVSGGYPSHSLLKDRILHFLLLVGMVFFSLYLILSKHHRAKSDQYYVFLEFGKRRFRLTGHADILSNI